MDYEAYKLHLMMTITGSYRPVLPRQARVGSEHIFLWIVSSQTITSVACTMKDWPPHMDS